MKKKKGYRIPGRHEKSHTLLYLISLPVITALGYGIGAYLYIAGIKSATAPFFPLLLQGMTSMNSLWGALIGIVAWLIFCMYVSGQTRALEPGKEYGESRIAAPSELLPHISRDARTDKILSQHLHMCIDDRKTGLTGNLLLIGGSGSGKSFRFVVPNILHADSSLIITDPKGTLLDDYGNYLIHKGFNLKVINLLNPYDSDSFNPFRYIRSENDIVRLVNDYQRATTPRGASENDPFWSRAEAMLETSLIQLMLVAFPEDRTMERFLNLLNMVTPPTKDNPEPELYKLFKDNSEKETSIGTDDITGRPVMISGKRAYENFMGVMNSAEETQKSIIVSALTRFSTINNSSQMIRLLSGDDTIDFRATGLGYPEDKERRTALFIVSSDIDNAFNGVLLWVLTTAYQELYGAAETAGGRLPIPVQLIWDEFANVEQPDSVLKLLATARSRGVSLNPIIQSQAQLKRLFKEEEEGVISNTDTLLYMGSQESGVHKYISEMCGKYTLNKQSSSSSTSTNGSSSKSVDSIGKDLLSPDRVRMLPNDKMLIMVRGFDPVIDDKYDTLEDPLFKEAMSLGKFDYHGYHDNPYLSGTAFGPLNQSEIDHYRSQGYRTISFSDEEFYALSGEDFYEDYSDSEWEEVISYLLDSVVQELSQDDSEYDDLPFGALKERLINGEFTDDQIAEANAGIEQGLSEEQILSYFRPEFSAERMKMLRLLFFR